MKCDDLGLHRSEGLCSAAFSEYAIHTTHIGKDLESGRLILLQKHRFPTFPTFVPSLSWLMLGFSARNGTKKTLAHLRRKGDVEHRHAKVVLVKDRGPRHQLVLITACVVDMCELHLVSPKD